MLDWEELAAILLMITINQRSDLLKIAEVLTEIKEVIRKKNTSFPLPNF